MKKFINAYSSGAMPRYIYISAGFFVSFILLFLLVHALGGWFFQDDIVHLLRYQKSLRLLDIITLEEGGRFIGHNVYWNVMYNIAGFNGSVYFVANILIIIGNSILLYYFIFSFMKERDIAIIAAVIYVIMLPTLANATWICYANHLLNHTFVFAFCWYYFANENYANLSVKRVLILSLLFLGSLWNAQYGSFLIPSLLFFHMLFFREIPVKKSSVVLLLTYSILLAIYLILVKEAYEQQRGGYGEITITLSGFIETFLLYCRHLFKSIYIFSGLALILLLIGIVKRDKHVLFSILAAGFCYAPIAFQVGQRFLNYTAIPILFFNLALIIIIKKYTKIPSLLILLFMFHLFINVPTMKYRADNPMGSRAKEFVSVMKTAIWQHDLHRYKRIYFKPLEKHVNTTKLAIYDCPIFWMQMGAYYTKSNSLKVLIDPSFEYIVLNTDDPVPGGYPVVFVDNFLFDKDSGIKKIVFPGDNKPFPRL